MKKKIPCPFCYSDKIIKKGIRKNKLQTFQKYYCKSCNKFFTNNKIKNKTYPIKIILNSISTYNLGHTLKKTSKIMNQKHKIRLPITTIKTWLDEFKATLIYHRIRNKATRKLKFSRAYKVFHTLYTIKKYRPTNIIERKTLKHHKQTFNFQYHKAKLDFFCNKFPNLKDYLQNIGEYCPNTLFTNGNNRISKLKLNLKNKLPIKRKYNYACKLADLALQITKNNKQRHNILENFMLINDTATIATEIPVYVKSRKKTLTGHIDILQVRFNKIYVLDFKPEAEKENPTKQLSLYTIALSQRTKTPLRKFRCAYFNEKNYFEFYPRYIKID